MLIYLYILLISNIITIIYSIRQKKQDNLKLKNATESCVSFSSQLESQRQICEKLTRDLKQKCAEHEAKIIKLVGERAKEIRAARLDSADTQRSVIKGKVNENMAPILPGWKWNVADARFYGSPVDFCIFKGLSEDNITEVIFVDVKSGKAQMSPRQKQIKKCLEAGKISWDTFRIE